MFLMQEVEYLHEIAQNIIVRFQVETFFYSIDIVSHKAT